MTRTPLVHHGRGQLYQDLDLIEPDAGVILVAWPHRCQGWVFLETDHQLPPGSSIDFCSGSLILTLVVDGGYGVVKNRTTRAWAVTPVEDHLPLVEELPILGSASTDRP